jgi:hypothetical protein
MFAISVKLLQPQVFKKIRSELTSMWNSTSKDKSMRRSSIRSDVLASTKEVPTTSNDLFISNNQDQSNMQVNLIKWIFSLATYTKQSLVVYWLPSLFHDSFIYIYPIPPYLKTYCLRFFLLHVLGFSQI